MEDNRDLEQPSNETEIVTENDQGPESPSTETRITVESNHDQSSSAGDDHDQGGTSTLEDDQNEEQLEQQEQLEQSSSETEDTKGPWTFNRIFILLSSLFCGTIGFACLLTLLFGIPVSMIAMGGYYINDCQVEPYIPIYLIVKGVFTIVNMLLQAWKKQLGSDVPLCVIVIDVVIGLFIACWFIAGNVWVYGNYNLVGTDAACNTHLYLFAFWMITLIYVFAGLSVICACLKAICC